MINIGSISEKLELLSFHSRFEVDLMSLIEAGSTKVLSREILARKTVISHEFVLPKDPLLVDAQISRICELAPLHQLTIEDCIKGNQRAKLEQFPDYLFFVIHYFGHEIDSISEVHVIIAGESLILVADNQQPVEYANWLECLNVRSEQSFSEMMHNIFDSCVDSAEQRAARLEDLVFQSENAIVQESFNPKTILQLKQHSMRFQRAVNGTHSVVKEFMAISDLSSEQKLWYRNILDHQERLRQELAFLHSEMIALFDVFWGASGFYANEQIKRLTLMATIGIPLAFWTSFFGMNFEVIPFREKWLFGAALVLMLLSVTGVILYLKRKGLFRKRVSRRPVNFGSLSKNFNSGH
jgi:magnesium transporter